MTDVVKDGMAGLGVSVVVVTWNRPAFVDDCLAHLAAMDRKPEQVIVVDASPDARTAIVVAGHPGVQHIEFPSGAGHMTASRNEALTQATEEIVAFLDDDANVCAEWLERLLECYGDKRVGAVSGRTLNNQPGEDVEGVEQIGRLLPNGELTGNFAADPGAVIAVDHGIGANMSFRRTVLLELGGFRDWFPGTALREDTDMFLRVRAAGHDIVFHPEAVADHVAAPHVKGNRFDYRYVFWSHHNHLLLLALNYGLLSRFTLGWLAGALHRAVFRMYGRNTGRRAFRTAVALTGLVCGLVTSVRRRGLRSVPPARQDATGERLRRLLL